MAACRHLFGDERAASEPRHGPLGRRKGLSRKVVSAPATAEDSRPGESVMVGAALPLLPLNLPPRRRHRFVNELDGPDYQDACDAADRYADERELALYGERDGSTRAGWSDENRAA